MDGKCCSATQEVDLLHKLEIVGKGLIEVAFWIQGW